MCGPEDPLFTPLLPLARILFQAKESVHKTPFWENLEILSSTASIFTQILAHKPPNFEILSSQSPKFGNFQLTSPQIWKFSAHKPPFSEALMSVRKPHTSEIRAAHPYLKKKLSAPPPIAYFGNLGRTAHISLPKDKLIEKNICCVEMIHIHSGMIRRTVNTVIWKNI